MIIKLVKIPFVCLGAWYSI